MRVLVVESGPGVSDGAVAQLESASHTVARCHDAGAEAFPCRAIVTAGDCPLENEPIDVALSVRSAMPEISPDEAGVSCAIRANIPLVVVEPRETSPYSNWTTIKLSDSGDVVGACELAASDALARHTEVAAERLKRTLRHHGVDGVELADARVTRGDGRLHVRLELPSSVPAQVSQAAVAHVVAAVRAIDRTARGIDVSTLSVSSRTTR